MRRKLTDSPAVSILAAVPAESCGAAHAAATIAAASTDTRRAERDVGRDVQRVVA